MPFTAAQLPSSETTLAALQNSRTKDAGISLTAGYASAGDGGGDAYVFRRSGRSAVTGLAGYNTGLYWPGPGTDDYWELRNKQILDVSTFGADVPGISAATCTERIQNALDALDAGNGVTERTLRFTPGMTYKINACTLELASRVVIDATGANFMLHTTSPGFTLAANYVEWKGGYFKSDGAAPSDRQAIKVTNTATVGTVVYKLYDIQAHDIARFIEAYNDRTHGVTYRNWIINCRIRNDGGVYDAYPLDGDGKPTSFGIMLHGTTPGDSAGNDTDIIGCQLYDTHTLLYTDGVVTKVTGGSFEGGVYGFHLNGANDFVSYGTYCEYTEYYFRYTRPSYVAASSPVNFTADAGTETITATAHGLSNGSILVLTTTGALPGGLSLATDYFVINKTDDTFQLSAVYNGVAIDLTSAGTGTHSYAKQNSTYPYQPRSYGCSYASAGNTEFSDGMLALGSKHLSYGDNTPSQLDRIKPHQVQSVSGTASEATTTGSGDCYKAKVQGSGTGLDIEVDSSGIFQEWTQGRAFTADAATDTLTSSTHLFVDNALVKFRNNGQGELPGGITAGASYYVYGSTANTFQLTTTAGDIGTLVDITNAGSGTNIVSQSRGQISVLGSLSIGRTVSGTHPAESHGVFAASTPNLGNRIWEVGRDSQSTNEDDSTAAFYSVNSTRDPISRNAALKLRRDETSGYSLITTGRAHFDDTVTAGTTATVLAVASTVDIFWATKHGFAAGDKGRFSSSGTLPGGLSAATNYYIPRISCVGDAATDTFTATSHGFVDGDRIHIFASGAYPGGISPDTNYYIVNKADDTFQVAATSGGAAIDFTTDGSSVFFFPKDKFVVSATQGTSGPRVDLTDIGTGTHSFLREKVFAGIHGTYRAPTQNQGNVISEIGRDTYELLAFGSDTAAQFFAIRDGSNLPVDINAAVKFGRDATTQASIVASGKIYAPSFDLLEVGTDPADPAEGRAVIWMGNGVGTGKDGDVLLKTTAGGVTTTHNVTSLTRKQLQDTVTFSATPTFDFDADTADSKSMTLTADVTSSTFVATRPGEYVLVLIQDATGSRTFTFPSNVKGNPPQPSATPLEATVYRFYHYGTEFHF